MYEGRREPMRITKRIAVLLVELLSEALLRGSFLGAMLLSRSGSIKAMLGAITLCSEHGVSRSSSAVVALSLTAQTSATSYLGAGRKRRHHA